jgi:hypothetical protein
LFQLIHEHDQSVRRKNAEHAKHRLNFHYYDNANKFGPKTHWNWKSKSLKFNRWIMLKFLIERKRDWNFEILKLHGIKIVSLWLWEIPPY